MSKAADVDQYLSAFTGEIALRLQQVRETIRKTAPMAEEVISYSMPAYKWNGILVWFAGYARHTGFYPGTSGIAAFAEELKGYKKAKGSVQFPHDRPLPLELIERIVRFRLEEQEKKGQDRKK